MPIGDSSTWSKAILITTAAALQQGMDVSIVIIKRIHTLSKASYTRLHVQGERHTNAYMAGNFWKKQEFQGVHLLGVRGMTCLSRMPYQT